jgi:hypothetical protein
MRSNLQLAFIRCGRGPCRCAEGHLHGPYCYLHHRDGAGRQHKTYVPRRHAPAVAAALAERRRAAPSVRSLRRALAAFRRLEREALA